MKKDSWMGNWIDNKLSVRVNGPGNLIVSYSLATSLFCETLDKSLDMAWLQ